MHNCLLLLSGGKESKKAARSRKEQPVSMFYKNTQIVVSFFLVFSFALTPNPKSSQRGNKLMSRQRWTCVFGGMCILHYHAAWLITFLKEACTAVSTSTGEMRMELAACMENISWNALLGAIYFDSVLWSSEIAPSSLTKVNVHSQALRSRVTFGMTKAFFW